MPSKSQSEVNPKPKREDFDRVLKALLNSPPITREQVHKETRKRKKKAHKVIENGINGNR
jgi:hypothetical protein